MTTKTSTDNDVARVRAVTQRLGAAPLNIWIFELAGDAGPDIFAFHSQDGAMGAALADMKKNYQAKLLPEELAAHEQQLRAEGFTSLYGRYNYSVFPLAVKP